ncbi:hypothetical protein HYW17_05935 [Candidatus Uhrbacteria bacterium]|nr:hypothetical protein [Candidatus Uhrbacteria bacterium]
MKYELGIMKNVRRLLLGFFLSIILNSLFLIPANGAELYFGAPAQELESGRITEVGVFLDTQGEEINAVEGVVVYPKLLELQGVREDNSMISIWIERPHPSASGVEFSGITPGGFSGSRIYLFSLVLRAKKAGEAEITARQDRALINDGAGTPAPLTRAPLTLSIKEAVRPSRAGYANYLKWVIMGISTLAVLWGWRALWRKKQRKNTNPHE